MNDPFKIDGPTCISFSGGRTSAYMLHRVLESNGGLPAEAIVCFANTGLENKATLEFVRDCALYWGVKIVWVEYRREKPGYEIVNFESASRDGEPFTQLIHAHRYLPNPMMRFCTRDLKTRPIHKALKGAGFDSVEGWGEMVGIRYDEPRRAARIRGRVADGKDAIEYLLPLADARVSQKDVLGFWKAHKFDLNLSVVNGVTHAGNCELCFLKPAAQIQSLIRDKPSRANWWIKSEEYAESIKNTPSSNGVRFRFDRPNYTQMAAFAADQVDMFDANEEGIACFCGD